MAVVAVDEEVGAEYAEGKLWSVMVEKLTFEAAFGEVSVVREVGDAVLARSTGSAPGPPPPSPVPVLIGLTGRSIIQLRGTVLVHGM